MKFLRNTFLLLCFSWMVSGLYAQDRTPSRKISTKLRGLTAIQFSPDGKSVAVARKKSVLFYLSGGGNSITGKYKTPLSEINDLAYTKDSMLYIAGKRGALIRNQVYVWNWALKRKVKSIPVINAEILNIAVSSNGKYLAMVHANGDCRVMEAKSGKLLYILRADEEKVMDAQFGSDDKMLYYITRKGSLFLSNSFDGSLIKKLNIQKTPLRSLSLSNDSKIAAVGADNGTVYLMNFEKNYELTELKNKQGRIYSMSFSADDQYLATVSNNRILNLWSMEQNALKKQIKIDSRKGTTTSVAFDPGCKLLYTCNYMDMAVRYYDVADLNIVAKTLFKNENDKTPPQIIITSPRVTEGASIVSSEYIDIKGMAIDESGMFAVFINGSKAGRLNAAGEFNINVRLTLGDNVFNVEATDVNNNVATKKFIVRRKELNENDLNVNFEVKNHLLVIGIDEYKNWPKLGNAVFDADAVRDVLYRKYGYSEANTIYIKNDSASRQGIIDAFKRLIERIGPNDNLVIYFSGHGHYDQILNEGYWIPVDAKKGTESDYLPNSFLLTLIKRLSARNVFLIADACFSGALFSEAGRGDDVLSGQKSRWGLTSGRLEYVSDGAVGQHSPFSNSLINILNKNEKAKLTAFEVVQMVKTTVSENATQTPIGNPLKNAGDEGGEFIFKLNK